MRPLCSACLAISRMMLCQERSDDMAGEPDKPGHGIHICLDIYAFEYDSFPLQNCPNPSLSSHSGRLLQAHNLSHDCLGPTLCIPTVAPAVRSHMVQGGIFLPQDSPGEQTCQRGLQGGCFRGSQRPAWLHAEPGLPSLLPEAARQFPAKLPGRSGSAAHSRHLQGPPHSTHSCRRRPPLQPVIGLPPSHPLPRMWPAGPIHLQWMGVRPMHACGVGVAHPLLLRWMGLQQPLRLKWGGHPLLLQWVGLQWGVLQQSPLWPGRTARWCRSSRQSCGPQCLAPPH